MLHPRVMSKLFTVFLLACLAVGGIHAQQQESVAASPRITATPSMIRNSYAPGQCSSPCYCGRDQGAAPGSLELGRAILVLKNSPSQQAALNKLTDDQQNSKSPSYHAWLTPAEYGARFGVASQDIAKINSWLKVMDSRSNPKWRAAT
jgi:subtilase family serine protease